MGKTIEELADELTPSLGGNMVLVEREFKERLIEMGKRQKKEDYDEIYSGLKEIYNIYDDLDDIQHTIYHKLGYCITEKFDLLRQKFNELFEKLTTPV